MCNSQADRGQKNTWHEKGVQQIGQVEIHNLWWRHTHGYCQAQQMT